MNVPDFKAAQNCWWLICPETEAENQVILEHVHVLLADLSGRSL